MPNRCAKGETRAGCSCVKMDRLNQPKLLSEMDAMLVQSFSRHRGLS